jgi:XTP/dITP diphosphohydrolase
MPHKPQFVRGSQLVLASHNGGKLAEFSSLLAPLALTIITASALGLPEPAETGDSFFANALLKARAAAQASGMVALADDSGLAVAALNGAPGIYSARWAETAVGTRDYAVAMNKVHEGLAGHNNHRAAFITVLALCWPDGAVRHYEGRIEGDIVWPPRGAGGFGYDPMFQPTGYDQTFAEMPTLKTQLSHRARACAQLVQDFDKPSDNAAG